MLGAASHSSELDDSARLASSLQKKIPVYLREVMVEQRFLYNPACESVISLNNVPLNNITNSKML